MGSISRTGTRDQAVAALAERQHGVISRSQARQLGLTDREIAVRLRQGHLHQLFHGTFAVGHRAITRRGQMLAAVLACDKGTVLSHGSAAELLGLWDKRLPVIHVIPPDWSGRGIGGIRWHRVRVPLADEAVIRDCIPCTTISRTIVDMAGTSGWGQLRRLVEQAAILRQLDPGEIDRILSRGRRRGAPRLRTILAPWREMRDEHPVLRSRLEARLLPRLIEEGLPAPRANVKLRVEGHLFEIDLLWEEQRLAIETDGEETHSTPAAFQRDRKRDQILTAAGYRTARITWRQVVSESSAVIQRISRMLKAT